jgi:protein-S-isoprenylcysteine O-methyltransferase Ste14
MGISGQLSRWRVPLGWLMGLGALYVARPTRFTLLAGVGVALPGELLRLWASGHLEKNRRLATGGPYGWTRNPLYLGSLLVGLGFCFATGRGVLVALLAGLFAAVYVPVMKREASKLGEAFPEDYARYAKLVPLFLPRPPTTVGKDMSPGPDSGFSWSRVRENRETWTVLGVLLVISILAGKMWLRR